MSHQQVEMHTLSSPPGCASSVWTNRNTVSLRMSAEEPSCLHFLSQVVYVFQALIAIRLEFQTWYSPSATPAELSAEQKWEHLMLLSLMASSSLYTPLATDSSMIHSTESGKLSWSLWTVLANENVVQYNPLDVPATRQPSVRFISFVSSYSQNSTEEMGTHPRWWITTRRCKQEESGGSLEECLPGVRVPQMWTTEQPCPVRGKARDFLFVSSG